MIMLVNGQIVDCVVESATSAARTKLARRRLWAKISCGTLVQHEDCQLKEKTKNIGVDKIVMHINFIFFSRNLCFRPLENVVLLSVFLSGAHLP